MSMLLPPPFRKLWLGEQSLPWAFWFYGFAISTALFLVSTMALRRFAVDHGDLAIGLRAVIMWPYDILCWVGIWRSANRYPSKGWANGAKVAVALFAIAMAEGFIKNGGFNRLFGLLMSSN